MPKFVISPTKPVIAQTVCVDFDGSTEYMANTTEQAIGVANAITASAWVKTNNHNSASNQNILTVRRGADNLSRFDMLMTPNSGTTSGRIEGRLFDSAGNFFKQFTWNNIVSTSGEWFNVTMTWNGTNFRLYKNGVLVSPATLPVDTSGTMDDASRKVWVSQRFEVGGEYWNGRIHSIAIWNKGFEAAEVKALYNDGNATTMNFQANKGQYRSSENLKHWWRLGLDSTAIGKDSVTSGGINIGTNAVGITSDDIVTDSPK